MNTPGKFNNLHRLAFAGAFAVVLTLPKPAHAATFTDDFSTGLDTSCWSVLQQTTSFFSADASQGNVQLLKASAHNPGGAQGAYVYLNFTPFGGRITNDFSTQVDFTNAVVPGPGLDQVELHTVYQDGSIYYAVYDRSSGYNAHVWDGGSVLGVISAPQNYGTFRIARTNGIVTAYFNSTRFTRKPATRR